MYSAANITLRTSYMYCEPLVTCRQQLCVAQHGSGSVEGICCEGGIPVTREPGQPEVAATGPSTSVDSQIPPLPMSSHCAIRGIGRLTGVSDCASADT